MVFPHLKHINLECLWRRRGSIVVSQVGIQNAAKSIIPVVGVAHRAAYRVVLQVSAA